MALSNISIIREDSSMNRSLCVELVDIGDGVERYVAVGLTYPVFDSYRTEGYYFEA